jgi:hypothetical protein
VSFIWRDGDLVNICGATAFGANNKDTAMHIKASETIPSPKTPRLACISHPLSKVTSALVINPLLSGKHHRSVVLVVLLVLLQLCRTKGCNEAHGDTNHKIMEASIYSRTQASKRLLPALNKEGTPKRNKSSEVSPEPTPMQATLPSTASEDIVKTPKRRGYVFPFLFETRKILLCCIQTNLLWYRSCLIQLPFLG